MRKEPIELPHSCAEKPTVSVIVPAYNHEKYIDDCLDGILMQEDCEFEVIIIEDDSSDRTREICIARQKQRPDRLRLILNHRENNIQVHGRPTGIFSILYAIDKCRGSLTAFCEGDDYWILPNKLRTQVLALQGSRAAACVTNGTQIGLATKRLHHPAKGSRILSLSEVIAQHYQTASLMIRHSALHFLGSTATRIYGLDRLLFLTAHTRGGLLYLAETSHVYRKHSEGASASQSSNLLWAELCSFRDCDNLPHRTYHANIAYIYNRLRSRAEGMTRRLYSARTLWHSFIALTFPRAATRSAARDLLLPKARPKRETPE